MRRSCLAALVGLVGASVLSAPARAASRAYWVMWEVPKELREYHCPGIDDPDRFFEWHETYTGRNKSFYRVELIGTLTTAKAQHQFQMRGVALDTRVVVPEGETPQEWTVEVRRWQDVNKVGSATHNYSAYSRSDYYPLRVWPAGAGALPMWRVCGLFMAAVVLSAGVAMFLSSLRRKLARRGLQGLAPLWAPMIILNCAFLLQVGLWGGVWYSDSLSPSQKWPVLFVSTLLAAACTVGAVGAHLRVVPFGADTQHWKFAGLEIVSEGGTLLWLAYKMVGLRLRTGGGMVWAPEHLTAIAVTLLCLGATVGAVMALSHWQSAHDDG